MHVSCIKLRIQTSLSYIGKTDLFLKVLENGTSLQQISLALKWKILTLFSKVNWFEGNSKFQLASNSEFQIPLQKSVFNNTGRNTSFSVLYLKISESMKSSSESLWWILNIWSNWQPDNVPVRKLKLWNVGKSFFQWFGST